MEEGGGSFLDIVFTGCYNDGVDEFGHEKRNERAFQYWVVLISILETKSVNIVPRAYLCKIGFFECCELMSSTKHMCVELRV